MIIQAYVDFPPSVNRLWRIGPNKKMYRSAEYTKWRQTAMWQVAQQAKFHCIDTEYKLTIRAAKPDKRKRDLDNLIKALSDVLESAGVIKNDSLAQQIDIAWSDEHSPCFIQIETIGD